MIQALKKPPRKAPAAKKAATPAVEKNPKKMKDKHFGEVISLRQNSQMSYDKILCNTPL